MKQIQLSHPIQTQGFIEGISTIAEHMTKGKAFPSALVLKTIAEKENSRIDQEKLIWRIGGAAVGLLAGSLDGLDFGDAFQSFFVSNLAGTAHDVFSEEQKKFLREINSYWIIDDASPMDLNKRVGPARSRVWFSGSLYNYHRGLRGDYLLNLQPARAVCQGFSDRKALEVMVRSFDDQTIKKMSRQFYPTLENSIRIDSYRVVDLHSGRETVNSADLLAVENDLQPIAIEIEDNIYRAYAAPIPLHSDF